jgi:hypothetical protein
MNTETRELSQAEFAREMGVSRAAVSQWKSKDILRDSAFSKPGKKGKVLFHVAVEQVRRNRDIGQSLGNGIGTRTTVDDLSSDGLDAVSPDAVAAADPAPDPVPVAAPPPPDPAPRVDSVEDQLKRAKLEQQLRTNRREAEQDALERGTLMATADAREQMSRIAAGMLQMFEGALPGFSEVLAERFDLPQRDVLHLLREQFRKARKEAAKKEGSRAGRFEETVQTEVES